MTAPQGQVALLLFFPARIVPAQFTLADGAQARHDSKPTACQLQTEARAPQQQVVEVLHVFHARAPAQLRPQGLRAGNRRQFAIVRRIAQRLRPRAMTAQ